ncbi:MAG: FAD-dependent oxidoreductase, partial [bacterium]
MLLDARTVPEGSVLETDLCVVGGGVAGITIATEAIGRGMRVMLLESGAQSPHEATQALYDGVVAGRPYYPLRNCRVRQLGGTSAVWGGWCRPLDALDFEERAWMPFSGWPFPKEHLDPAYERAQQLCGLGENDYGASDWRNDDALTPLMDSPSFCETLLQIRATRFGEEFRRRLEAAENVQLLLRANVLSVDMDAVNRTAQRVHVSTLGGTRFFVRATRFVLAAGGLENPRLLLASRGANRRGIGNDHDLVGRFFFDHLHAPVARLRDHDGSLRPLHATSTVRGTVVRAAVGLSREAIVNERLYGFGVTFHNARDPHDIFSLAQVSESYDALRYLLKTLARGERPARAMHHAAAVVSGLDDIATMAWRKFATPTDSDLVAGCRAEQAPARDSRVTLDDSVDALGAPRVRLDW